MDARLVEDADWVTGPVVEGETVTETEDPGEAEPDDPKGESIVVADETLEVEDMSDEVCDPRLEVAEVVFGKLEALDKPKSPNEEALSDAKEVHSDAEPGGA